MTTDYHLEPYRCEECGRRFYGDAHTRDEDGADLCESCCGCLEDGAA